MHNNITLQKQGDHICGRFSAMASPCELLFDFIDEQSAKHAMELAYAETKRIENKYSRYLSGNLMHKINNGQGNPVAIDSETYQLLDFANTCYQLSDGQFDISSGILRKVWRFDGSNNIPSQHEVEDLLRYIGWSNISYTQQNIIMPAHFELDFGGIGKEYAVNKVALLMSTELPEVSVLVNFGGDIQVTRPRKSSPYWQVGIENPASAANKSVKNNNPQKSKALVNIAQGGLATSGDANRFLLKDNKRYSHILNPKTGYPLEDAPRSVTVAGEHCIQAGLLATLALLQGKNAEQFLQEQDVVFWCYR